MTMQNNPELVITYKGERRELVCSPHAMMVVGKREGSVAKLVRDIQSEDFDAYAFVVRAALNVNDNDTVIAEQLFNNGGMFSVAGTFITYLGLLRFGGKLPDDVEAEESGEGKH